MTTSPSSSSWARSIFTFASGVIDGGRYWPVDSSAAPVLVPGHADARLIVRFVPDACSWASFDDWGRATLRFEVDNGWRPSIGRNWEIPGGLMGRGPQDLGVLPPAGYGGGSVTGDSLREACALLAAAPA
jgi:hypothetical protein